LGELEDFLNARDFLRIHLSFLVSKDKIDSFSSNEVEVAGKAIPIGRSYIDSIKREFEKF